MMPVPTRTQDSATGHSMVSLIATSRALVRPALLGFRLALASDAKAVAAEWSPSPMKAAQQRASSLL